MKYTFDVENIDGHNQIKLDIALSPYANGSSEIIIDDNFEWPQKYNDIISQTIDNMRLTVKEREEAYKNSHILSSFLFGTNPDKIICD